MVVGMMGAEDEGGGGRSAGGVCGVGGGDGRQRVCRAGGRRRRELWGPRGQQTTVEAVAGCGRPRLRGRGRQPRGRRPTPAAGADGGLSIGGRRRGPWGRRRPSVAGAWGAPAGSAVEAGAAAAKSVTRAAADGGGLVG